ncbi:MAG: hypothetical protein H0W81_04010 [Chloroflexi bacterium]|nr:hypothetical protein [Chloroflexota bacterium]
MNWGSGITAVLAVLGIFLIVVGMMDQSTGDRDLPVIVLGIVALIAGGVLQVWSQRRT